MWICIEITGSFKEWLSGFETLFHKLSLNYKWKVLKLTTTKRWNYSSFWILHNLSFDKNISCRPVIDVKRKTAQVSARPCNPDVKDRAEKRKTTSSYKDSNGYISSIICIQALSGLKNKMSIWTNIRVNAKIKIWGPVLWERWDFDQQIKHPFLKYPWVGWVKMNNFLYYVSTYFNRNVTLSILM